MGDKNNTDINDKSGNKKDIKRTRTRYKEKMKKTKEKEEEEEEEN